MELIVVAGLTFVTVVGVTLAIWWVLASEQAVRARLVPLSAPSVVIYPTALPTVALGRFPRLAHLAATFRFTRGLNRLTAQAGWPGRSGEVFASMALLAGLGAVLGGARIGHWLGAVACAIVGAVIPVVYLQIRRRKRIEKFSEQFPDSMDMMTRALRAGYALGAAIQVAAEEMPDPVGSEFKRVFEEMSLGVAPGEALQQLYDRMPTEDVRFFYAAVSIQREVGGNLAEILNKLSEVIRERFRILSYARVLSAQQKGSAYCIAVSPFVLAILFNLLMPGYFDPLLRAPIGPQLILGALALQVIGFFILKRIADIQV